MLLVQFLFQQVVDLACFLPDLGKVLLNGGVVLQIFPNEHQREADEQQQAGPPDGPGGKMLHGHPAKARTHAKQEDDAKIMENFAQGFGVVP